VSCPPSRFANNAANAALSGVSFTLTVGTEEVVGGADRLGAGPGECEGAWVGSWGTGWTAEAEESANGFLLPNPVAWGITGEVC
jgi:hypothetical protein